jgi:hypothetical protein
LIGAKTWDKLAATLVACTGNTSNSNQHLVDVLDPFLLVTCSFEGIYATCLTSFGKALSLGFGGAGHCDMFKKLNCGTVLLHRYGQSLEHLHHLASLFF